MENSDDAAEVERIFRQYVNDYPKQVLTKTKSIDFDALGFWSFPLMTIGDVIKIYDRESFDKTFRLLYDNYRDDGWIGRVDVDAADVHIVRDGWAILEGKGSRYRGDGSLIDRWDLYYIMHRTNGRWRTIININAGQPRPNTEQWIGWARSVFG